MHQHALQTALSLYESGTYTLETAARHAGIEESRFLDCIARRGIDVDEQVPEGVRRRRQVAAD